MKTIYKYDLKDNDITTIYLPEGSRVISFMTQGWSFRVWVLLDNESEKDNVARRFVIYGTGDDIAESLNELAHIGTVAESGLVWHCFEIVEAQDAKQGE